MAAFKADDKLKAMRKEVNRVFDGLHEYLEDRRNVILARLTRIYHDYGDNAEMVRAIEQINEAKERMKSNKLVSFAHRLDDEIRHFKNSRIETEDLKFVEFRFYSDNIRNAINEMDLYELCPEYVGRENPILKACEVGRNDGELANPRGIVLNTATDLVYVCDYSNTRIQVLTTEGEYLEQFGSDHLTEPWGICISQQEEVFVTDRGRCCVMKFSLTGEFLKQAGSKGNGVGQFTTIAELCCEAGKVYICDSSIQQVMIFDSELNYIKDFGYGQLSQPTGIRVLSDTIYILSREKNCLYCYNLDCTRQKIIQLTGQEQTMSNAHFFTTDKKGNFLITDSDLEQIRIFSPEGVLRHILGRGHLPFLHGITVDDTDSIICLCSCYEGCFKKF